MTHPASLSTISQGLKSGVQRWTTKGKVILSSAKVTSIVSKEAAQDGRCRFVTGLSAFQNAKRCGVGSRIRRGLSLNQAKSE